MNYRGGTRPGTSAPKSRVPPALNRVPPTTGGPGIYWKKYVHVNIKIHESVIQMLVTFYLGRASIATTGRPLNDRTNRYYTFVWVMTEGLTHLFSEAWPLGAKAVWPSPASLVVKDQHGMSKVGMDLPFSWICWNMLSNLSILIRWDVVVRSLFR